MLLPLWIKDTAHNLLALTTAGRLLMFPVDTLSQLSRGKGNKIISIPSEDIVSGKDDLASLYLLSNQASAIFHIGKCKRILRSKDLQNLVPNEVIIEYCYRADCVILIKWKLSIH